MLKNDTLKNGTSCIGLYGSAPPVSPKLKMSEILLIRIFQHKIFSSPEQGNILGRHSHLASIVYRISTPKRLDYGYNFRGK